MVLRGGASAPPLVPEFAAGGGAGVEALSLCGFVQLIAPALRACLRSGSLHLAAAALDAWRRTGGGVAEAAAGALCYPEELLGALRAASSRAAVATPGAAAGESASFPTASLSLPAQQ
eukprot:gene9309-2816_t